MNKSIWTKEIDEALHTLLGNIVLTDGTKPKIVFKYPDIDYDDETLSYPIIQISALTETFDEDRYDVNYPKVEISREGTVVVMEELAKPYKILYYIEPIAKYLEEINELTLRLNALFGKFYNLSVLTADGEPASVQAVRSVSSPLLELDTRKKRRLFKRTVALRITAFADFGIQHTGNINIQNVIEEV